jgi:succinyl-diaminopimelate desuccinylase
MKKLAFHLISFQSDKNHPEEIKRCLKFVATELKKAGLKVKAFDRKNNPSLIAAPKLKKHYQFILNGHLDVVPASYKNAFKATIKGNRLYGRGAADMKGPVAAMITLAQNLIKNHPQIDFALMITTDEETGGFDGVDYLVNKKGYVCNCAIVPDGGPNFELVLGEKGVLFIKIETRGKTAHGSQPWLGENALDKLINIYTNIKKKMPQVTKKDNWQPTVNLGVMSGGDATNKVCHEASAQIDFRYPQIAQRAKILKLVKKEVKKEKGANFKILVEGAPLANDVQNSYFKKIQEVAKKRGQKLKIKKEHGASDGRFFSAKGIPVLIFKPVCSPSHIDNEWIDLKSSEIFYQILKDFLLSFKKHSDNHNSLKLKT